MPIPIAADAGRGPRFAVALTRRSFLQVLLVAPLLRLAGAIRTSFTSIEGADLDLLWHRCCLGAGPLLAPG